MLRIYRQSKNTLHKYACHARGRIILNLPVKKKYITTKERRMERTVKKMVVVLSLMVLLFASSAHSCGVDMHGLTPCLANGADPKPDFSPTSPCCVALRTVDLSCICLFDIGIPIKGLTPMIFLNFATSCLMPTPTLIC